MALLMALAMAVELLVALATAAKLLMALLVAPARVAKPLWACFSPSTSHTWKLALWKWFLEYWMFLLVRILHAVASVAARDELVVCSEHNCPQ